MKMYPIISEFLELYIRKPSTNLDWEFVTGASGMSEEEINNAFRQWSGMNAEEFINVLQQRQRDFARRNAPRDLFTDIYGDAAEPSQKECRNIIRWTSVEGEKPSNEGKHYYQKIESPFGDAVVVASDKGICSIHFIANFEKTGEFIGKNFSHLNCVNQANIWTEKAEIAMNNVFSQHELVFDVQATEFQKKVWGLLCEIPAGALKSYSELGSDPGSASAARAIGNAVGSNPVAVLIPCHRVLRNTGEIGNFRWGTLRKHALIGWEAVNRI
ncbi:MAG: methylated-DNA--[protein]-cysteine S-methyltransferase [Weeksellaceae bacterium]|nr:methylated-DNA--[protein]-cysteine S-methyltransferase [Weeksellaceae bacterium]